MHDLSLRELVTGVHEGRFRPGEIVRACGRRIEERESAVGAWEHLALDTAADRAIAQNAHGALAGAPIAVKDIIDVAGMPTRYGSPIYSTAEPAQESAWCVRALEDEGALVLGKTVTTEFAYYTPGKTRNPWNTRHTPGGSSMGSAAAVACGMAAGALGTQTNGSIIRPAAFCGVVGFKPSYGTVSNHGTLDPWPTLDHTGVFARSVGDAALLASAIAASSRISAVVPEPSRPLRFAAVRSPVWHLAESSQRELFEVVLARLTAAGARVETLELPKPYSDAHRVHRVIMAHEGARHFDVLQGQHRDRMSARFNELIDEGRAIGRAQHEDAVNAAKALRETLRELLHGLDAVLTPPATGEAPATLEETGNPAFCTIWTLLGVPALTIPVALGPAGLPLGLQIVCAAGEDDRLLSVSAWCEAHFPFRAL